MHKRGQVTSRDFSSIILEQRWLGLHPLRRLRLRGDLIDLACKIFSGGLHLDPSLQDFLQRSFHACREILEQIAGASVLSPSVSIFKQQLDCQLSNFFSFSTCLISVPFH